MNALIGLDRAVNGTPILDLFGRLGFADCRATLAYAAEQPTSSHSPHFRSGDFGDGGEKSAAATLAQIEEEDAHDMLDEARSILYQQGIHSTHMILHGHPGSALMAAATQMEVDIVAASSSKYGPLRCAVFGSVCRALTISARQSVLIARDVVPRDKPLTAVFATEHTDYCDRAVETLIKMNPMGIQKMVVMTAIAPHDYEILWAAYDLPASEKATLTFNRDKALELNSAIAKRFRTLSMETSVAVIDKPVRQAINEVMADNDADLLILAAPNHGFLDRMTTGSLSLHETVAEKHSLFILRP